MLIIINKDYARIRIISEILINSPNTLGCMDIFWGLLKNGNYISASQIRSAHLENY